MFQLQRGNLWCGIIRTISRHDVERMSQYNMSRLSSTSTTTYSPSSTLSSRSASLKARKWVWGHSGSWSLACWTASIAWGETVHEVSIAENVCKVFQISHSIKILQVNVAGASVALHDRKGCMRLAEHMVCKWESLPVAWQCFCPSLPEQGRSSESSCTTPEPLHSLKPV